MWSLQIGYAYLLGGNRAAKAYRVLGRMNPEPVTAYSPPIIVGDSQGERIANVLESRGDFNYGLFSEMHTRLAPIFSEKSTTNQFEEAISWLGKYLGFAGEAGYILLF